VTEFPWSWSRVPDSGVTVTSLESQSQLVVNYGSGGLHWSFTAPSRVVEDGLLSDFVTLYLPNITDSPTTTSAAAMMQPSTGIVVAGYNICPGNEESCGKQWDIYPLTTYSKQLVQYDQRCFNVFSA
jgi:hypothetical protein